MDTYIFLKIYIAGLIVIPLILGILNRLTKFLTTKDFEGDVSEFIFVFLMGILLWPVVLVAAIIGGLIYGFYKVFVPEDK